MSVNKICRLCLRQGDEEESLIDFEREDLVIKEVLSELFQIKVSK